MSKCYENWQRLPNSRMDRQHRAKQFFRKKDRVDSFDRIEKKELLTITKLKKELEKEQNG